jgi:bacillithiol biosynthesis deacetylase BshB1
MMRILAIGIHPDDIEIGCGGTVARCAARGDRVVLADLTAGETATNGTAAQRAEEAARAAEILGCSPRLNLELPDAGVRADDPEQLRRVVGLIRAERPHVVLVPSSDDPHPDHANGGTLTRHALFLSNVNGYRTEQDRPQQRWRVPRALVYGVRREARPDVVVDVTAVYEQKLLSVRAHATQVSTGEGALPTSLNSPDFFARLEARDRLAGRAAGVSFGEAFELIEPIVVDDLSSLVRGD